MNWTFGWLGTGLMNTLALIMFFVGLTRKMKKEKEQITSVLVWNVLLILSALMLAISPIMLLRSGVISPKPPPTTNNHPVTKNTYDGTYNFTVIGFGSGVGLSQHGAKILAEQGWSSDQIIKHYYFDSQIAITKDAIPPMKIAHDGVLYDLREYLARTTYGEMGRTGMVPDEALKAQIICSYTIAKKNNFKTTENNIHLLSNSDWNSNFAKQYHSSMLALVDEVLGQYISYNGTPADTLLFASCNGYTANSKYAWGGDESSEPAPYLTGGRSSPEPLTYTYPSFTTDQIRSLVSSYNTRYPNNAITLGSDASKWIKILKADKYGYVEQIQIGDRVLTGGNARLYFFGASSLRSHNFTLEYISD